LGVARPTNALTIGKHGSERATRQHPIRHQPATLSLLVFSDARVQDLSILIEHVASLAPRPDFILYAGDDVDRFHPGKGVNYFAQLAALSTFGLAAVIGNDDARHASRLIVGRRVYDAHARTLLLGRFAVIGLAGAPVRESEHNIGLTLFTERALASRLQRGFSAAGHRAVILLSHAPPHGTLDFAVRFGARRIGSHAVARAIDTAGVCVPLVICGHVHGFGGQDLRRGQSIVINSASQDSPLSPLKLGRVTVSATETDVNVSPVLWDELLPIRRSIAADDRVRLQPRVITWTTSELQRVDQLGPVRQQYLQQAGINTIAALACAPPLAIAQALKCRMNTADAFVTRARAVHLKRSIALGSLKLPSCPRVFVDVETDLAQKRIWMCGCLDAESGEFVQFSSKSFESYDESAMMAAIATWLDKRPEAAILHYSGSNLDGRLLRSRFAEFGLICSAIARMVDVLPAVRRAIAPPCGCYSLKEIALCAGYRFRHPHLDGLAVASTYMDRVRDGVKTPITKDLREYNEDDVRSLECVCKWAERQCTDEATRFESSRKHVE
jgi:Icc-related predicted phosphoesterase